MEIFARELDSLYLFALQKRPQKLPPLKIQYADYVYWQRQLLKGELLQQQLKYWQVQLEDLSTLELPFDYARPLVQSYLGKSLAISLSPELSTLVKKISRKENVTVFTTLFTAYSILLNRYSSQDDVAIGTAVAGRSTEEIEAVMGLFVNTVVLRSNCKGQPDFNTMLKRNHNMTLAAYQHQDVP